MRNAQTSHTLIHWRYHLNDWVADYLKEVRELTPEKIVERDGWNTKRRQRDAKRIVKEMKDNGQIRNLHRDFRAEIDTARDAKVRFLD